MHQKSQKPWENTQKHGGIRPLKKIKIAKTPTFFCKNTFLQRSQRTKRVLENAKTALSPKTLYGPLFMDEFV